MNDFEVQVQQGWQCPLCKRIYSPFTPCCLCCGGEGTTKTSTNPNSTSYVDWQQQQSITTSKYIPREDTTTTLNIGGYTITYPLKGEEE